MKLNDPITKGRFHFATRPPIEGEILYAPSGQGDCWIVLDEYGLKHWIQQFDFMTETPPDPAEEDCDHDWQFVKGWNAYTDYQCSKCGKTRRKMADGWL